MTEQSPIPLSQPYPGAHPIRAIWRFYRKYATFRGRASRSEFWSPSLALLALAVGAGNLIEINAGFEYVAIGVLVASVIPMLAVSARRLHDSGGSAWWLLIYFIPCVGAATLLVFMVLPADPKGDKYDLP